MLVSNTKNSRVDIDVNIDTIELHIEGVKKYGRVLGRIFKALDLATEISYTDPTGKKRTIIVNTTSLFKHAVKSWIRSGRIEIPRAWGGRKIMTEIEEKTRASWVSQAKKESKGKKIKEDSLSRIIAKWKITMANAPLKELFPMGRPQAAWGSRDPSISHWKVPLNGNMFNR